MTATRREHSGSRELTHRNATARSTSRSSAPYIRRRRVGRSDVGCGDRKAVRSTRRTRAGSQAQTGLDHEATSPRRISDAATRHSAFGTSGERHASAQQNTKYGRVCARDDRARVGARRGARTCCGRVVLGWSFLRASVCCTFQIGHKFHAPGLWVHDACATVGADAWLTSAVTHLVPLAPNATPPKPLGWHWDWQSH